MKKIFFICCSLFIALSTKADPITYAKALQLAQEFIVPGHQMKMAAQAPSRRAADRSESAPYYVISRGEDQGYVIIAGDDCLPEVLGYTDHGNFDATDLPPTLQEMLDRWQEIVEATQADGSNVALAAARKAAKKAANNRQDILPFATSHWEQGSPYNDHCPTITSNGNRALTGCVATAASQILYYWRKDLPSTLQASTPTYGYGDAPVTRSVPKGTPLKWDLMVDKYGSEPKEFKEAVAEFVFATGAATWLTYGSSTSGNIEKIPYTFSTYFGMNGGTVHYRNSYTQEAWTQLIYGELLKRHPVMYTGVHPDKGGHAVFIHGYQASTDLFYFNFGWGNNYSYDGYYTTTETDGMNGFSGYQSALIGAYPKKWNLTTTLTPPEHVYVGINNKFQITIENNSTLDYSGVYLFVSSSATKPSNLSKAKAQDTETIIPTDSKVTFTMPVKPTTKSKTYITVTDANLQVLAQASLNPETAEANLRLERIFADASSDTETLDGETYHVVYNSQTTAYATLHNLSSIPYEGNMRLDIEVYDETTKEWTKNGRCTGDLSLEAKASGNSAFSIKHRSACPIEQGKHYRAKLVEQTTGMDPIDVTGATDLVYYFVMRENDMAVVDFADGCLSLQGHFDTYSFGTSSFAKRAAYETATIYDLTQCTGVGEVPQVVNPNALVYVADDSQATGANIVRAGICPTLELTPGYDFTPRADFTALQARITIGTEPARWYLLTMPFDANVPDGIIARHIMSHTSSGISNSSVENVKTLEAGKTYLIMSSSASNMTISAENVKVVAAPATNADPAIVGTYTATTTPANALLLGYNDDDKAYFLSATEGSPVEALRGFWYTEEKSPKNFRAYPSTTIDPAYVTLAETIQWSHDLLAQHEDIMTPEACASYLAVVQDAEHKFTYRSTGETTLTSVTLIQRFCTKLQADCEELITQTRLRNGLEVDCTGHIVNPSFEKATTNVQGWTTGTRDGVNYTWNVLQGNLNTANRAVGLDGANYFRSLIRSDSTSVSLTQEVKGLVPGHYRLTAMVGTDSKSSVTLFANEETTDVAGHPFGTYYLTQATIDDVIVRANEGEETGTLTIGIKEGRWYKADDFTLTYTGLLSEEEQLPTGIDALSTESKPSRSGIYTLQGVQVSQPQQPGIYIIDGKKTYRK